MGLTEGSPQVPVALRRSDVSHLEKAPDPVEVLGYPEAGPVSEPSARSLLLLNKP